MTIEEYVAYMQGEPERAVKALKEQFDGDASIQGIQTQGRRIRQGSGWTYETIIVERPS